MNYRGPAQQNPAILSPPQALHPPETGSTGPQWHQPQGQPAHGEPNHTMFQFPITGAETAGQVLMQRSGLGFRARSMRAFNSANHIFSVNGQILINALTFETWYLFIPAAEAIVIAVYKAAAGAGDLWITVTEQEIHSPHRLGA